MEFLEHNSEKLSESLKTLFKNSLEAHLGQPFTDFLNESFEKIFEKTVEYKLEKLSKVFLD